MDDIDQMLQGSDQIPASTAQQNGQPIDDGSGQPPPQQTAEEVEFNKLSGNARDRFKAIVRAKNEAIEENTKLRGMQSYVPPAPGSDQLAPDQQVALQNLSKWGVTTDDKMNRALDERLNLLRWDQRQNNLESKYTGGNGDEPQYVREEVEDFIRSHPQYGGYDPEDVFKYKMFPDEFMNLELSKRGTKTGKSQTLKPTSRMVSQEQGLTPEYIADRTDIKKYPDALEWQEEHRQEIDKVLSQMQAD